MRIKVIDEYNDKGHLLHAVRIEEFRDENNALCICGSYGRGRTFKEAESKLLTEIRQYLLWRYDYKLENNDYECIKVERIQLKRSNLCIEDADSDVIFENEEAPLTMNEYAKLKQLALRSAMDFQILYNSIPNKAGTILNRRTTFYGDVPITAEEMYNHTKNVNAYYFGELGVDADNEGDILSCRKKGFKLIEKQPDFLVNNVYMGSYGERWSLAKVMRRFIWHDRIHARAMYRMAIRLCGRDNVLNPFKFIVPIDVVAALIWRGDRFLACQRPARKARGLLWEFVGGKVEKGESSEQALVRECREELGIEVKVRKADEQAVFIELTHEYPDITVHLTVFNAEIIVGEPKLLEHNSLAWLTADEIENYEFCPADREILEAIKCMKKTSKEE